MEATLQQSATIIRPEELLSHWQEHRSLTRRVIEAFPEKELFEFSIGGMRPFAAMVMELIGIAAPSLRNVVSGKTEELSEHFEHGNQKAQILKRWDADTEEINRLFNQIPMERFHEQIVLFGKYENSVWYCLFYALENEIHHRGQGYVYLRALGIEPPFFWERKF